MWNHTVTITDGCGQNCASLHLQTHPPVMSLTHTQLYLGVYLSVYLPALKKQVLLKSPDKHSAPLFVLTLEARLSFFMACIIPRRPRQPGVSLRPGPAAGELSWDATSELGMMLMLSDLEVLSSMLGSAPFRQLKVFRLLWGSGAFNSVGEG